MAFHAVLWKEVREQYLRGGRPTISLVVMGVVDVLVGVVFPASLGQAAGSREAFLAGSATVAGAALSLSCLALPISVVIDTVAGERERHTLETLLASPARDRDIVLGKAAAILLLVAAQVLAIGTLSLATWTAFAGMAGLLAALGLIAAGSVVGLLAASYTTGLGLVISQRAKTVRSGQQALAWAMIPFFLLPSVLGRSLSRIAEHQPPVLVLGVAAGAAVFVFVVLNAVFWAIALAGFQRGRLLSR